MFINELGQWVLEIVGLQIILPDLIWTIINFFLLFILVNKFLFKPCLKVLDARKAKIAESTGAEAQAKEALEISQAECEREIAKTHVQAREILSKEQGQAQEECAKILLNANEDAAAVQTQIQEKIAQEKCAAEEQVSGQLDSYVSGLVGKLLSGKAPAVEQ